MKAIRITKKEMDTKLASGELKPLKPFVVTIAGLNDHAEHSWEFMCEDCSYHVVSVKMRSEVEGPDA